MNFITGSLCEWRFYQGNDHSGVGEFVGYSVDEWQAMLCRTTEKIPASKSDVL
jgi:hypothetical protein